METQIESMINDVKEDGKTVLLGENKASETPVADLKQEEKTIEKPAEKTEEPQKPVKKSDKSYLTLSAETEPEQKKSRFIPVSEIQKERQRRHAIEQENAELKAMLESQKTAGSISPLIEDPEALVDGKTVVRLIQETKNRLSDEIRSSLMQEQEERESKSRQMERLKALKQSENEAREKFTDFDDVVSIAVDNGFLTEEEVSAIGKSKNPGAVLYRKSKEILSIMGIQPVASAKVKPNENKQEPSGQADAEQADKDIYSEVFSKKP